MGTIKHIDFYGLKLSVFDEQNFIDNVETAIIEDKKIICYGFSFGIFPYFKKYPQIPYIANQFDILGTDGRGLYIFSKLLGYPLKSDLSIPQMVYLTLKIAEKHSYSIMLLGAREEINKRATERIRNKYHRINVFDGHHGYFKEEDELQIVDFINRSKPNILLIGISSPIKEQFAHKWKELLECNIVIPCGGVIDILAGITKPTPRLVKKIGLAWFYRFIQEPRRLFRDSILHTLSVVFLLIPSLLFQVYFMKKPFSIPEFYSKTKLLKSKL